MIASAWRERLNEQPDDLTTGLLDSSIGFLVGSELLDSYFCWPVELVVGQVGQFWLVEAIRWVVGVGPGDTQACLGASGACCCSWEC